MIMSLFQRQRDDDEDDAVNAVPLKTNKEVAAVPVALDHIIIYYEW